MRTCDAYASERSYLDHVLPIWSALPPEARGQLYVAGPAAQLPMPSRARHAQPRRAHGSVVLVASAQDHLLVRQRGTVFIEHGAGQTYRGDEAAARHTSYAGGQRRDGAKLFVCPSERVALLNRLSYPSADAVVVGSPKLDPWHAGVRACGANDGVVAISFHADFRVCPETRSALEHYRAILPYVAGRHRVIGHGHPRWWDRMARLWSSIGVEPVKSFADVLDRADVYVCDNSSTLYEFASTGRPVVALNAPWYRRDVDHGLRFWSHVPGRAVDVPDELDDAIEEALRSPWSHREQREAAVREAFAFTDGRAAQRAAAAVQDTI